MPFKQVFTGLKTLTGDKVLPGNNFDQRILRSKQDEEWKDSSCGGNMPGKR
ncbi:MAG TPA: hypothetical protein VFC02_16055 [Anaerolineales bacterium]|nr:hypothetical protein [Anaerolineales bacterium]